MKFTDLSQEEQNHLVKYLEEIQLEETETSTTHSLVKDLAEYINELTDEIVKLRQEVNESDKKLQNLKGKIPKWYQEPYADLYSDVFRVFNEHKAYEEFKEELDVLTIQGY